MNPEHIRNVVLVGHGGAGKTSLAEALLYVSGDTTRLGVTEEGNTVMDSDPEEVARGMSLSLGIAAAHWHGHKINILDAPGFADFVGEAQSALRAADLALFVVSGVDGVEVQTEILWKMAGQEGIPRAIFVNKLDRERSNFSRTLDQLKDTFGKRVAPVQVPVGAEENLKGITRVVSNRTYFYDGSKTGTASETPESMAEEVSAVRTALIEAVVETDDAMLEAYFDGVEPTTSQIVETVHRGMLAGEIFPVLCGSARTLVGVDTLGEFLIDFGPRPLEHAAPPLIEGELSVGADGDTVAYVFKTVSDPYVGRVSLFRVFSGSVKLDDVLEASSHHAKARMHNLFFMQGSHHTDTNEVVAGDIAAVAKVEETTFGDTLRTPGSSVTIEPVPYPRPVMEVAVTPRSAHDDDKLSTALQRTIDEDPTLRFERRAETHETVLSGMGDTHLDVTIERIARKFGVQIDTAVPKVPYRETITRSASAEGKHKKQSGGRGQYGVAFVRFEPLPSGSGLQFQNDIKGGSIPRQFIPAVEKGVREAADRGVLSDFPVIDLKATVYDGKYHSVDSDEMSFRMAGIIAFREAASDLGAVLLEPIMNLTIRVPEANTGDVVGDLNAKRGRVVGMDSNGTVRVINAEVPMAEIQRYAVDLRSMTQGRGQFEVEFDHYAEMPRQEAQRVIAASVETD